jgi:integrase
VSTRPRNQWVKLTKTVVDRAKPPAAGQAFVRDSELKGFGLRITANGVKTFIVEKRVDGRPRRKKIARYGELTCEEARREAIKYLGDIAKGEDPIADRERARLQKITLAVVFSDYLRARKALKPKTRYEYNLLLHRAFDDWQTKPIVRITKDMVAKRHRALGEKRGNKGGPATANHAMRFLRALFNFAIAEYEDSFGRPLLTENPVRRLNQTRAWYRDTRRTSRITLRDLAAWHRGIEALRAEGTDRAQTVGDYLLFLLLTGFRRQEAATLSWRQIDLASKTVTLPDPKNRQPFELPLSDFLVDLVTARRQVAMNGYVFPGTGRRGYLVEPKRQVEKVIAVSGVPFLLHDLRRTFTSTARDLGIHPYTISRLVNHKRPGDITASYSIHGVEDLRRPMQRLADCFGAALAGQQASIVPLRSARPF